MTFERTMWSEMGKQNIQAKKVYCAPAAGNILRRLFFLNDLSHADKTTIGFQTLSYATTFHSI